jgi:hypothetical protein
MNPQFATSGKKRTIVSFIVNISFRKGVDSLKMPARRRVDRCQADSTPQAIESLGHSGG